MSIEAIKETKKGQTLTYFVSDQVAPVVPPAKAIEAYRVVINDSTATNAKAITYAIDASVVYEGLSTHGANPEEQISVQRTGVGIGTSGEAIAFGQSLKAGADGKLFVAGAGELAIGQAQQVAGGADVLIGVALDLHNVPEEEG